MPSFRQSHRSSLVPSNNCPTDNYFHLLPQKHKHLPPFIPQVLKMPQRNYKTRKENLTWIPDSWISWVSDPWVHQPCLFHRRPLFHQSFFSLPSTLHSRKQPSLSSPHFPGAPWMPDSSFLPRKEHGLGRLWGKIMTFWNHISPLTHCFPFQLYFILYCDNIYLSTLNREVCN